MRIKTIIFVFIAFIFFGVWVSVFIVSFLPSISPTVGQHEGIYCPSAFCLDGVSVIPKVESLGACSVGSESVTICWKVSPKPNTQYKRWYFSLWIREVLSTHTTFTNMWKGKDQNVTLNSLYSDTEYHFYISVFDENENIILTTSPHNKTITKKSINLIKNPSFEELERSKDNNNNNNNSNKKTNKKQNLKKDEVDLEQDEWSTFGVTSSSKEKEMISSTFYKDLTYVNHFPGSAHWQPFSSGYFTSGSSREVPPMSRTGKNSLFTSIGQHKSTTGALQTIIVKQTTPSPLLLSSWYYCEGVTGDIDDNLGIFIDIVYQDGSRSDDIGLRFDCSNFEQDQEWRYGCLTINEQRYQSNYYYYNNNDNNNNNENEMKLIDRIYVYIIFRSPRVGKIWLDDLSLYETRGVNSAEGSIVCSSVEAYGKRTPTFRTHPFFQTAESTPDLSDVTLSSQLTTDKLDRLMKISQVWRGPMSVALYIRNAEIELSLVNKILQDDVTKQNLDLHLVYADRDHYPVNTLRNFAIENSRTEWTMMIDIDFIPSVSMRPYIISFREYLESERKKIIKQLDLAEKDQRIKQPNFGRNNDNNVNYGKIDKNNENSNNNFGEILSLNKVNFLNVEKVREYYATTLNSIFIVPAFQSKRDNIETKKDLLVGLEKGEITTVHQASPLAHGSTEFETWYESDQMYSIKYVTHYEPYFIQHKTLGRYDERFRGYGHDKESLPYELYLKGVQFWVLPHIFVTHLDHYDSDWKAISPWLRVEKNWYEFIQEKIDQYLL